MENPSDAAFTLGVIRAGFLAADKQGEAGAVVAQKALTHIETISDELAADLQSYLSGLADGLLLAGNPDGKLLSDLLVGAGEDKRAAIKAAFGLVAGALD